MCNINLYYLLIVLRNNDIIINHLYSSISKIIIIVTISIINKERGVGINAQDYLFTPPRPMHILPVANIPIIIITVIMIGVILFLTLHPPLTIDNW